MLVVGGIFFLTNYVVCRGGAGPETTIPFREFTEHDIISVFRSYRRGYLSIKKVFRNGRRTIKHSRCVTNNPSQDNRPSDIEISK